MYVERKISGLFQKVAGAYTVVAVVGPRQAGKTTFLKEKMRERRSSYVLFDDPDARALFDADIKKFEKQYLAGYELAVLDEAQQCKDAGSKLKYLADTGNKIWVTSSSETLLEEEVLSYLVGRVSIVKLYPFSLREFLAAKGQKETTTDILERSVWEHMAYGGYPKAVITEDTELKKIILKDLYETMLLKDVARTFSIEDLPALEAFTRYLSINTGGLLSYESIMKDLKLSFQTLKKYLDALEKSYIIIRVPPFHTNKTKEITKQPKAYFIDTGLRNHAAKEFNPEPSGELFENYVLTELLKEGFTPKYWRTKTKVEVDFIIENDRELIPIEVKLSAEPGRVERSLRSFIEEYKPKKALVVSYKGAQGSMQANGCTVHFTDALNMTGLLKQ